MRLDKCLADCGLGTRSEVKSLLKAKRITVNGKVVNNGKVQVNPETDEILFDGETIQYEEFVYIMMNKPKGVVSATEDNLNKTVLDLIDPLYFKKGVFPVGRLDIDTHGLLLLTNDGELAHRLLSPKSATVKWPKRCWKHSSMRKAVLSLPALQVIFYESNKSLMQPSSQDARFS